METEDARPRPLGDLHRRAAARLLDALTVFAMLFALVVVRVFWFMDDLSARFEPDPWGRAFVATATFVVMFAIYEIVFIGLRGQTPGKDALNLRVQRRGVDEVPGPFRAGVRWLAPGLLCLVSPIWVAALAILALGVTAVTRQRRAVHDWLAGTEVVVYDADLEEGATPEIDEDERRRTYGPRSIRDLVDLLLQKDEDRDRRRR